MKNAITNYTLNVDKLFKHPSPLQQFFDNVSMCSATRLKMYPIKDVISFTFFQDLRLYNHIRLNYELQGKFKIPYLFMNQLDKVNQKNQHTFKFSVLNLFNTMKWDSTLQVKKAPADALSLKHDHIFLLMPGANTYFGAYAQMRARTKPKQLEIQSHKVVHMQVSVMKNIMHQ